MNETIDWWDTIKKMTKEELISQILSLGGKFIVVRADASDSYTEVDYKGWTIKAAGLTLIDAYKHALDAIYWIKEDFADSPPNIIVSI